MEMAGHVSIIEEGRTAFKMLTGTPTRKILTRRRKWEDKIRMNLKEICVNTRG